MAKKRWPIEEVLRARQILVDEGYPVGEPPRPRSKQGVVVYDDLWERMKAIKKARKVRTLDCINEALEMWLKANEPPPDD